MVTSLCQHTTLSKNIHKGDSPTNLHHTLGLISILTNSNSSCTQLRGVMLETTSFYINAYCNYLQVPRDEHRTQIQLADELDEILRLMVAGASNKQIMQLRNLPERTFYDYQHRLQDRIIAEQMNKRHEEIMIDKQIVKDRLIKSLQLELKLMDDEHISPRTRMDAGTRHAEIAVALLKLETEMLGFLHALNESRLEQPLHLPQPPDAASLRSADTTEEEVT